MGDVLGLPWATSILLVLNTLILIAVLILKIIIYHRVIGMLEDQRVMLKTTQEWANIGAEYREMAQRLVRQTHTEAVETHMETKQLQEDVRVVKKDVKDVKAVVTDSGAEDHRPSSERREA